MNAVYGDTQVSIKSMKTM